jgi:hypothetical protein
MILQKNGINQKKELLGTNFMVKNLGKTDNIISIIVKFVKKILQQDFIPQISVAINALLNKEETQEKIMKLEFVQTAKMSLNAINTTNKKLAQDSVLTIKDLSLNLPVYNLEVEDEHHYFANGILVHNCLYAWAEAHHHRIKEQPVEQEPNEKVISSFLDIVNKRKNLIQFPKDEGPSWYIK